MNEELIAVKDLTYCGLAYRMIMPEPVLAVWNKKGKDRIPVAFFKSKEKNNRIIVEPLEDSLGNPNYSNDTIKTISTSTIALL